MKAHKIILIFGSLVLMSCDGQQESPEPHDTLVSCTFSLGGGIGSVVRFTGTRDDWLMDASPIQNLECEGKRIELASTTVAGGVISTKEFGTIETRASSSSGRNLRFYMQSSQAERLKELE